MNVQLTESLKKNNQEQLSEAIREMIKQNIKYQADFVVQIDEGLDSDTIRKYVMKWSVGFGVAIGPAFSILELAVFGGALSMTYLLTTTLWSAIGMITGAYVGTKRLESDKVRNALMNTQVAEKFDKLVATVTIRDSIMGEYARYTTVKERNKFHKRVGRKMAKLTSEMKRLSSELRADLLELGDELEINEYDRENLMKFLEQGEKAAISDVLSDQQRVQKIVSKVENDTAVA